MATDYLQFITPQLLQISLTHRSFLNENKTIAQHNERLEFLGDAVLELAVSEFIYKKFPQKPEGELTALRSALVRTSTLAQSAKALHLGEKLRMSKGESLSGGRENIALLANTFEAVIGALYLSAGYSQTVKFLEENLYGHIDTIIDQKLYKDFKSSFQEFIQSQGNTAPEYRVIQEEGPDHDKEFTIGVYVDNNLLATGVGKSKQMAQQKAAQHALEKINRD